MRFFQVVRFLVRPAPLKTDRNIGGERRQPGDKGIIPGCFSAAIDAARLGPARPANDFEAAQFRANQEQIDATRTTQRLA